MNTFIIQHENIYIRETKSELEKWQSDMELLIPDNKNIFSSYF